MSLPSIRQVLLMTPMAAAMSLLLPCAAATAAPKELWGKSITITWQEDRMQRLNGQGEFQPRSIGGGLNIYVSTQGNVFNRMTMTAATGQWGRGHGVAEGSNDQVGGGNRNIGFQGHGMTIIGGGAQRGARLITVTFDPSFSSCTATAIRGKQEGASSMIGHSLIRPGTTVEIQSVHTSGVTCSIKDGNVFGSQ